MSENDYKMEERPLIESEEKGLSQEKKTQKGFPKCIFFILGNEFCERYSYYGMRTILVLYLKYYLHLSAATATSVFHAFTVLAYFFPVFGAIMADSYWGKYNTILWLSIVYVIGMLLNTFGAVKVWGNHTTHAVLSFVGLFVIAVGTGGIKSCVSAFGGDQFETDQDDYRRKFFSLFYFVINAGSLLSTFISPIVREKVQCFGYDCYALAFGIPAALMVVATVLFFLGTKWYKRNPPSDRIFFEASSCIVVSGSHKTIYQFISFILPVLSTFIFSQYLKFVCPNCTLEATSRPISHNSQKIKNRCNTPRSQRAKSHWMDYALDGSNPPFPDFPPITGLDPQLATLVRDIKYVLRILILYIPLPLFWTLFDQQGSRWTLQAVRMDGYIGSFQILPDQMQICNPLFIVTLIPLFEVTLYPCLRRFNIHFSPLKRMGSGMFLAGFSFVVAALVQMKIDVNLTNVPSSPLQTSLRVINAANCSVKIQSNVYPQWRIFPNGSSAVFVQPEMATKTKEIFIKPRMFYIRYACATSTSYSNATVTLHGKHAYDFVISDSHPGSLKYLLTSHKTEKSSSGKAFVGVINTLNVFVTIITETGKKIKVLPNTKVPLPVMTRGSSVFFNLFAAVEPSANVYIAHGTLCSGPSDYPTFCNEPDGYTLNVQAQGLTNISRFHYAVGTGGLYTVVLRDKNASSFGVKSAQEIGFNFYTDVYHNDISLMWMIPQYLIITLGEVFLSVTGLEFSYSQSPPSMKAILQALWLLTVSMGDVIVLIVAESRLVPKQADEYFLFAGLIGVATTLFAVLANRYEYVDETEFTSKESNGVDATDESMNLDDENDTALSNGAH